MKNLDRFVRPLQALLFTELAILGVGCSITDYDGFVMAAASAAAHGLTPFVDFPFAQGPLLAYLYAPLVRLFGPELLPTRLLGIVFAWLLYLVTLKTAARWFAESRGTDRHASLVAVIVTLMWVLYPEFLGALPRIGSKESVASFFCVMSVCGPFMFPGRRYWGVLVSALFVALSIGMKYTMVVLIPPLTVCILACLGWREALVHLLATGAGCLAVFAPYALTGNFDYVVHNFKAPETLVHKIIEREHKAANPLMYVAYAAWPALLSLARAAMKYQLVLAPALACFLHDLIRVPPAAFFRKKETILLLTFAYLCATASLITPAMHRLYMFIPLLLIFAAASWARLLLRLEDGGEALSGMVRSEKLPLAAVLVFLLGANTVFLFQFQYNDGGFPFPNLALLRLPADKAPLVRELDKLCAPEARELLYVGEFQDRVLSSKCRMSPYSVMSYPYLPLDTHYPLEKAERYKFMTQEYLLDRMRRRHYPILVFDDAQVKDGVDYYGVDYGAISKVLKANYDLHFRAKWMSIYTAKPFAG